MRRFPGKATDWAAHQRMLGLVGAFALGLGVTATYFKLAAVPEYRLSNGGAIVERERTDFSRADLEFLKPYWRPLVEQAPLSLAEYPAVLRATVEQDARDQFPTLARRFPGLSERSALFVNMVMRANGSIAVYLPRSAPPTDFNELMLSQYGNCTDFAVRLVVLAHSIGVPARLTRIWSPSLPGHAIVEAYDPVEKKAWLLDGNLNLAASIPSDGEFFFESVARKPAVNEGALRSAGVRFWEPPLYFRYYDPGLWLTTQPYPLALEDLNAIDKTRHGLWVRTITTELDATMLNWTPQGLHPVTPPSALEALPLPAMGTKGLPAIQDYLNALTQARQ